MKIKHATVSKDRQYIYCAKCSAWIHGDFMLILDGDSNTACPHCRTGFSDISALPVFKPGKRGAK